MQIEMIPLANLAPYDRNSRTHSDTQVAQIAESLDVSAELLDRQPVGIENVPGLKWCALCWGELFLAGDAGGYFCAECQPVDIPGRMVLATVARAEHVVD